MPAVGTAWAGHHTTIIRDGDAVIAVARSGQAIRCLRLDRIALRRVLAR